MKFLDFLKGGFKQVDLPEVKVSITIPPITLFNIGCTVIITGAVLLIITKYRK